jgi:hypothetical protein
VESFFTPFSWADISQDSQLWFVIQKRNFHSKSVLRDIVRRKFVYQNMVRRTLAEKHLADRH